MLCDKIDARQSWCPDVDIGLSISSCFKAKMLRNIASNTLENVFSKGSNAWFPYIDLTYKISSYGAEHIIWLCGLFLAM